VSAVIVAVATFVSLHAASESSTLRTSDGSALYTAIGAAAAAIATLGLVPMSIIVVLSSQRVQRLLSAKSDDIRKSLRAGVVLHVLAAALSVALMAFDSAETPLVNARCGAVALFAIALDATLRVVVEFLAILKLGQGPGRLGKLPPLDESPVD
jgi:hypothetical protein